MARAAARMSRRPGACSAEEVAEPGDAPGLVDRGGGGDPVADPAHDDLGIVGEPAGDVAVAPAAEVGQRRRKLPVVEGGEGPDAAGEQAVDQPVVEVEALGVRRAAAFGQDARPGHREAVGVEAGALHQVEVGSPSGGSGRRPPSRPRRRRRCRASRRRCPSATGRSRRRTSLRSGRRRWRRRTGSRAGSRSARRRSGRPWRGARGSGGVRETREEARGLATGNRRPPLANDSRLVKSAARRHRGSGHVPGLRRGPLRLLSGERGWACGGDLCGPGRRVAVQRGDRAGAAGAGLRAR